MWSAIKSALWPPQITAKCAVTIPAYDPKYRPARHIKAGDRVIYRAGVCIDKEHPLEGMTGTVHRVDEPNNKVECEGYYFVGAVVDFDDRHPEYGSPIVNARNLVTLADWLVEREKARLAA